LSGRSNILQDKHFPLKLDGSYVVISVKAENKISIFRNNMTAVNDSVGETIIPDTYHNLDSSIQEYYFECVEPILVYSCKRK
jgi:hypothetical protein